MIRVYKHPVSPQSLERKSSWKGEDVIRQLMSDQYRKCYLCERVLVTDFEVDHIKSRANHQDSSFQWKNLLWSCGYCNKKKSSHFDNIIDPTSNDVECQIYQKIDFPNSRAIFRVEGEDSEESKSTAELLKRIFNGSGRFRSIREQQMYDYAKSRIISFQNMVISWLNDSEEDIRSAIVEQLDIKAEFLGFKYWIIRSNPNLLREFGEYIIWNKIKGVI